MVPMPPVECISIMHSDDDVARTLDIADDAFAALRATRR